jgi:hypothetical protein
MDFGPFGPVGLANPGIPYPKMPIHRKLALERPRRGSTPWPPPIQEHAEPEQAEEHKCVEKLVVSHVVSPP